MKIINNTDINNLIIFAKHNMGIYRLVYLRYKKIYWLTIVFCILCFLSLVLYLIVKFASNKIAVAISFLCCIFNAVAAIYLCRRLEALTENRQMKVQEKRLVILQRYYQRNNYTISDIIIINKQLEKRLKNLDKQKTTAIVVLGILVLPIWETMVEYALQEFTTERFVRIIAVTLIMTFFITIFIHILNRGIYLYEENVYVKNNSYIIENIIYLNHYIIKDWG